MTETKECVACAELIRANAKLCRFCNTDQSAINYANTDSGELKSNSMSETVLQAPPRTSRGFGITFMILLLVGAVGWVLWSSGYLNIQMPNGGVSNQTGTDADLIVEEAPAKVEEEPGQDQTIQPDPDDILGRLNKSTVDSGSQGEWRIDPYAADLPAEIIDVYLFSEGDNGAGCSVWVVRDFEATKQLIDDGFFDWHYEWYQWGEPTGATVGAYMIFTNPRMECYKNAEREFGW